MIASKSATRNGVFVGPGAIFTNDRRPRAINPDGTLKSALTINRWVDYASGDGGWFGAAVDMFRTIAADGYPTVGISSKAFMKLAHRTPLKPETLTAEYLAILARAREALGLAADTPVVLTGWSRGASLAVITAAQPIARPAVRGVVAIGLTHGEDLKVDGEADETDDDPVTAAGASTDRRDDTLPPVRHDEVDTYALLRGLAPIRSADRNDMIVTVAILRDERKSRQYMELCSV